MTTGISGLLLAAIGRRASRLATVSKYHYFKMYEENSGWSKMGPCPEKCSTGHLYCLHVTWGLPHTSTGWVTHSLTPLEAVRRLRMSELLLVWHNVMLYWTSYMYMWTLKNDENLYIVNIWTITIIYYMIKYVLQKTKWATISGDWLHHKLDYTSAATNVNNVSCCDSLMPATTIHE